MTPKDYFKFNKSVRKKQYDALHDFYENDIPAGVVADKYGYTIASFYSLTRDFTKYLNKNQKEDFFFKDPFSGRKPDRESKEDKKKENLKEMIIRLRKKNFSVQEIVGIANSKSHNISYTFVYNVLRKEGFARLPRRSMVEKKQLSLPPVTAPETESLTWELEKFHSSHTGLFAFLPVIVRYGIDRAIERSTYPGTQVISKLSSILCFLALKLSDIKRYSQDDLWCMDRGMGLFAGLNVLPKAAWFSSYSGRVDSGMNLLFLKELHEIWRSHGLLSDTSNLDFTTIPYWGNGDHLENNWSGKRGKALASMLAVLAQDPQSGIIDYGDCHVLHSDESAVVPEYLDFYRAGSGNNDDLKYLVFDSKFTNYQNLSKLDDNGIKFITIRRRGGTMLEEIKQITGWKTIRVETGGLKKRTLKVHEQTVTLPGYKDEKTDAVKSIRQVVITGNGKIKPAVMLTNDTELPLASLIRKYSRRWLVEKGIAQQIDFFHLNRVSSSMVIKVDFDLTMSILAHNLYRLFAMSLERYQNMSDERIHAKFVTNNGNISIEESAIRIDLKKKRELPLLLEHLKKSNDLKYSWLDKKTVIFDPSASS
jgi:hypothetical protein